MSINTADVIRYARQHIKLAPLLAVGGTADQPGLDICQDVINKILSRPFNWKWNRSSFYNQLPNSALPITTTDGQYAYGAFEVTGTSALTDVGWLERAYIERTASTSNPKDRQFLEVVQNLAVPWFKGQPKQCAWEMTTVADALNSTVAPACGAVGTVSCLRIGPIPDAIQWSVYVDYQKVPPILTDTTTDVFDPIPDTMSHVVRQLFLAYAYRFVDDRRADMEMAKAEAVLNEMLLLGDVEPDDAQLYPMRPIQWG